MKILIVEPHFDDAWINLGGYILLHPKDEFTILTVSHYPTNKIAPNLRKHVAAIISEVHLDYKSLGFEDSHMRALENQYPRLSHSQLFLMINKLNNFDDVKRKISNFGADKDLLFWPLGMKHPQHIIMSLINPFTTPVYYREFPYFFYADQQQTEEYLIKGKKKITVDISLVLDKKIELFRTAYKTQQFLLNLHVEGIFLYKLSSEVFWQ